MTKPVRDMLDQELETHLIETRQAVSAYRQHIAHNERHGIRVRPQTRVAYHRAQDRNDAAEREFSARLHH